MTNTQSLARENISSAIRSHLDALEGRDGATLHDLAKALDGLVSPITKRQMSSPTQPIHRHRHQSTKPASPLQQQKHSPTWDGMRLSTRRMGKTRKSE
jgi:hypothetical protein